MEPPVGREEAIEKVSRTCISCGKEDTGEYCSFCGSKLEFLGDERASSIQNLRNIFREYFREVLDPTFAYIKTIYLLLFQPVPFFHTLYSRDHPINAIPFPLKHCWEKVSGRERTQYTLHPIAFFTSNIVINLIAGALILPIFYMAANGADPRVVALIPTVSAAGFLTLLQMLATAFIFDILTKESHMTPLFKYSFWVYTFSLVWIGWMLGLLILMILLPFTIIFCCALLLIFGPILTALFTGSVPLSGPHATILTILSYLSIVLNFLFSSIGIIYIFGVTPFRVFSNIFRQEGLPTKNLWRIIPTSLIIPLIPVLYFIFLLIYQ